MTSKQSDDGVAVAPPAKVDVASLFPASVVAGRKGARRRRRRAWTMGVAGIAVVAVVGAGIAMRASGSDDGQYRTSAVSQRQVDALLNGVATIEPVAQASVAFPVSGTVAAVAVAPGDTVTVGQTLATLDTTALQATLHQQQAALDQANLVLSEALAGKSVSSLTGASAQSFAYREPAPGEATATLFAAVKLASTDPDVAAAQQAVLDAQKKVDSARNEAATSLTAATKVCAAIGVDAATPDPSAAVASINACQTALNQVVTDQTAVNDAQSALATASSNLDDLLQKLANATPPPTTEPPTTPTTEPPTTPTTQPPTTPTTEPAPTTTVPAAPTTTVPSPTSPSTPRGPGDGSGTPPTTTPGSTDTTTTVPRAGGASRGGGSVSRSGGGGSSASRSSGGSAATAKAPTAADLVAYQSAVDAATANVTVAQQAIDQATIVSPIAGTVMAVNLAAGDAATAASTTQDIMVAGDSGFEATTTVSLDHIPDGQGGPDRHRGGRWGPCSRHGQGRVDHPRAHQLHRDDELRRRDLPAAQRRRTEGRRHRLGADRHRQQPERSGRADVGGHHNRQRPHRDGARGGHDRRSCPCRSVWSVTRGRRSPVASRPARSVVLANLNEALPSSATQTPSTPNLNTAGANVIRAIAQARAGARP